MSSAEIKFKARRFVLAGPLTLHTRGPLGMTVTLRPPGLPAQCGSPALPPAPQR